MCEKRYLVLLIIITAIDKIQLWANHDISTLKLLQIVHRHGDRAPTHFSPNDPYQNQSQYWPDGVGQLTKRGKYRLYKLGQFFRHEYGPYLGEHYSPREVYARSSIVHRCLESVSCLLAGAYPPTAKQGQWSNDSDAHIAHYWQPIAVETFMPIGDDNLLTVNPKCPNSEREFSRIFGSDSVLRFLDDRKLFLANISKTVGTEVNSLILVNRLYDTLRIEQGVGLLWSRHGLWSVEYEREALEQLREITKFYWSTEWNNRVVQRIFAGNLVDELTANMLKKSNEINSDDQQMQKLFVYSTHDSVIAVLMEALGIFNGELVPFGAALILELHQNHKSGDYFVRIYYYNETLPDSESDPYLLSIRDCNQISSCPLSMFLALTNCLIPDNWITECGLAEGHDKYWAMDFMSATVIEVNVILTVILIALIVYNFCYAKKRYLYMAIKN